MKYFFYSVFFSLLLLFVLSITYLSVYGIETTKFNNLIIKEIEKKNSSVVLKLEKIKIKLDLKKFSYFYQLMILKLYIRM